MDDIITELEDSMYGLNYAASFGYCVLPPGKARDVAQAAIVRAYPDASPRPLRPATAEDLWENIRYAFDYRGDFAAGHTRPVASGLHLDPAAEASLRATQQRYRRFVEKFIAADSTIYSCPNYDGLPCYPVFWEFQFVVLNENTEGLFLYGAASD